MEEKKRKPNKNFAQVLHQDSGNVEWRTPAYIIEAARATMGGVIELDPASSAAANEVVQAATYYTQENSGLSKPWIAQSLWMNHPYSRKGNKVWIAKLVREYRIDNVQAACCICYAAVSAEWFRPLLDFPRWVPPRRVHYINPATGKPANNVLKDSVVTYLGSDIERFVAEFQDKLGGSTDIPYWRTIYPGVAVRPKRVKQPGGNGINGSNMVDFIDADSGRVAPVLLGPE